MRAAIDLTGQSFYRWRVRGPGELPHEWICQCTCGGSPERVLTGRQLRNGNPKSCGCLRVEACIGVAKTMTDSPWTDEKVEFLLQHYQQFTRAKLAVMLGPGFSKNSVIAKLNRLGLSNPVIKPPPPKKPLFDVVAGACMWPHGDPGEDDFHFCGATPVVPGRSYCAVHVARAFERPKKAAAA